MRTLFTTFKIKRFDFVLLFLILCLNLIGIAAIGSANASVQGRQIYGTIAGIIIMFLTSAIDYKRILKHYWILYGICVLFLLSVLVFGVSAGGAQRWLVVGRLRFQPSEAAKILLILFYAQFIMKYKSRMKSVLFDIFLVLIAMPPLFLIYKEPDGSTTVMIFVIIVMMMFIGGMNGRFAAGVLIIAIPAVVIFLFMVIQDGSSLLEGYQRMRILAWLHPEDYATTYAYQTMNSIMAIGSGQLTGKGYNTNEFNSVLGSGYISESQTDFIFTVIGEEFGFVGSCTVVLLVTLITIRLIWNAKECKDLGGCLIAAGMGTWIGLQGFWNIGVTTGVTPNTGLPLPFVSYGLTSLLCLYFGIGVVMNVRMQNDRRRQASELYLNLSGSAVHHSL